MSEKNCRRLVEGDVIQAGDEYYNPDWEVDGPWYVLKEGHESLGLKYDPRQMKIMRRQLED